MKNRGWIILVCVVMVGIVGAVLIKRCVEHNHEDDDHTAHKQFLRIGRDDDEHDEGDGQRRHGGQVGRHTFCELRPESLHDESRHDGQDDHPEDAQQHAHHIHIDTLACQSPGQQGCQQRSQQGGNTCHSHRERQITFRQISNDIRGRATRTAAHEHHAHSQRLVKLECFCQSPCQQRHDGELRHTADDDVLRATEDNLEVLQPQRHAHAEHDDAQQRVDDRRLDAAERAGRNERHHCRCQHQHAHIVRNQFTELFHFSILFFLVFYISDAVLTLLSA